MSTSPNGKSYNNGNSPIPNILAVTHQVINIVKEMGTLNKRCKNASFYNMIILKNLEHIFSKDISMCYKLREKVL